MEDVKFRIAPREPVRDGLVRAARARIDEAIARVEHPGPDRGEDLHEVRTACKRLRAIWRLARPHHVSDLYEIENRRLAETARRLSGARDARVAAETLRAIEAPGVEEVLARFEAARPDPAEVERLLASSTGDLRATGEALAGVPFPAGDWACLRPGLRQTYRRARDLALDLRHQEDDTSFHECRKQVKYLWYQLRLLEAVAPIGRIEGALRELQRDLGDDHDLVVTAALLPVGHDDVRARLSARSSELRRRIRHSVGTTFEARAKRFVAELESGALGATPDV